MSFWKNLTRGLVDIGTGGLAELAYYQPQAQADNLAKQQQAQLNQAQQAAQLSAANGNANVVHFDNTNTPSTNANPIDPTSPNDLRLKKQAAGAYANSLGLNLGG